MFKLGRHRTRESWDCRALVACTIAISGRKRRSGRQLNVPRCRSGAADGSEDTQTCPAPYDRGHTRATGSNGYIALAQGAGVAANLSQPHPSARSEQTMHHATPAELEQYENLGLLACVDPNQSGR